MAVDAMAHDARHKEHLRFGLSDDEGRKTFLRASHHACPQLQVSTLPLAQASRFYSAEPYEAVLADGEDTKTLLENLVAAKLGVANVDVTCPMVDLGIDSIVMIDLLEDLQKLFEQVPDLSAIDPQETLTDLAARLDQQRSTDTAAAKLCGVFAQTLNVSEVTEDQTLLDLCIDSLTAIDLIEAIANAFGSVLSVSDFDDDQTVAMIASKVIDDPQAQEPLVQVTVDQWRKGTGKHTLCFVHPVGGETACYRPLLEKVGPDVTVFAISDPKLRAIDPASQPIPAQAASYLAALGEHLDLTTSSVDLFGWSFGGWVAQEMAVQAERAGTPFNHVTMVDPPDPESGSRIGEFERAEIQSAFLYEIAPRLSGEDGSGQPLATQIAPELQNQLDRLVTCCALNMDAMKLHYPDKLGATPASVFVAKEAAEGLLVEKVAAQDQLRRLGRNPPHSSPRGCA